MYYTVCMVFRSCAKIYHETKTTRNINIFPSSVEFYFKILYLCKILGENSKNITLNIL